METNQRISIRRVAPLAEEDEAFLVSLAPSFARPIAADSDVASTIARARKLAVRLERLEQRGRDLASDARRERADELDRRATLLEHVDALWAQAVRQRARQVERISAGERSRVAAHALTLARMIRDEEPRPWSRAAEAAAAHVLACKPGDLRDLARVVRAERQLRGYDELRRRAFHALRQELRRLFGRSADERNHPRTKEHTRHGELR